jgi:hypothetical protein
VHGGGPAGARARRAAQGRPPPPRLPPTRRARGRARGRGRGQLGGPGAGGSRAPAEPVGGRAGQVRGHQPRLLPGETPPPRARRVARRTRAAAPAGRRRPTPHTHTPHTRAPSSPAVIAGPKPGLAALGRRCPTPVRVVPYPGSVPRRLRRVVNERGLVTARGGGGAGARAGGRRRPGPASPRDPRGRQRPGPGPPGPRRGPAGNPGLRQARAGRSERRLAAR